MTEKKKQTIDREQFKKMMISQAYKPSKAEEEPKLVRKNVLQSRKFPGSTYIFEETLGKGMQSTVWKFIKDGEVFAAKQTSKDWIYEKQHES